MGKSEIGVSGKGIIALTPGPEVLKKRIKDDSYLGLF